MLDFSVPDTDATAGHTVETRPKAVAAWLDRLPYADPVTTACQLFAALHALNRHPLSADDRHALLAQYRPAVARAAASREAPLADFRVPPPAPQRQVGALLRDQRMEHRIGYKHQQR